MGRPDSTPGTGTGLASLIALPMLRITVTTLPDHTTLVLEGRLCGPWVAELASCWRDLIATRDAHSIRIDLDGVTFVDAAGKALIRAMHDRGAMLVATEVMTRTIVDEVATATARTDARDRPRT